VCHKNFSLRDEIEYNFFRAKEREMQQNLKPGSYPDDYLGRLKTKQFLETQQSIKPTEPASLEFDGYSLTWKENGQPVKSYQAQSGRNNLQHTEFTNVAAGGPIPEGDYLLKRGTGEDYNNKEEMSFWNEYVKRKTPWYKNPTAWGKSRIPIQPQTNTNTFGRDKMYVHGGTVPGSSGCIDLTTYNDDFYNNFKNYDNDLSLKVKYKKGW